MSDADAVRAEIAPGNNVLVLATDFTVEQRVCSALLDWEVPATTDFLAIDFTNAPDDRLDRWQDDVNENLPARTSIITIAELLRGISEPPAVASSVASDLRIKSVPDPADLTGLGMAMTDVLEDWQEGNRGHQIVGCLHSLTTLLQYADVETVFRFLHVFTTRLAAVDAITHYHMDPEAHEEQTIHQLEQVFDAVIDTTGGAEEWEVRHR